VRSEKIQEDIFNTVMHYKNGRSVKVGDRVIGIHNGLPKAGIVIDTVPGSTACNIAIVPCPEYVSCSYQSKDFLHMEDVASAEVRDSSKPQEAALPPTP